VSIYDESVLIVFRDLGCHIICAMGARVDFLVLGACVLSESDGKRCDLYYKYAWFHTSSLVAHFPNLGAYRVAFGRNSGGFRDLPWTLGWLAGLAGLAGWLAGRAGLVDSIVDFGVGLAGWLAAGWLAGWLLLAGLLAGCWLAGSPGDPKSKGHAHWVVTVRSRGAEGNNSSLL
jgi:hypothetical protein